MPIHKAVRKFSSELTEGAKMACFILIRMTNINTDRETHHTATNTEKEVPVASHFLFFWQYMNNFYLYLPSNLCRLKHYFNVSFFPYTFRPGNTITVHAELLFWSNVNFEC